MMEGASYDGASFIEEADENDDISPIVRLKKGFQISDLTTEDGVELEIDTDELERQADPELTFDEGSLKYAKYELLDDEGETDEESEDSGLSPFQKMTRQMVDITKDKSGSIMKKIIREGDGPTVPDKAKVFVHYNGYTETNPEPFDSTLLRSSNCITIRLDCGEVILGLDYAIKTMRKGEKSSFLIQHEYAFGPMGCPPRIEPEATVLFEVELFSFIDDGALLDFEQMTPQEQLKMDFEKLYVVCSTDHKAGNEYFKKGQYSKAALRYEHAIRILEGAILHNDEEQMKWQHLLGKLLVNLALVKDLLDQPRRSATFAKRALALDKNNVKALFRLGHCQNRLGEYDLASKTLMKAKQFEPNNPEIIKELDQLNTNIKRAKAQEKNVCVKMMASMKSLKCDDDDQDVDKSKVEPQVAEEFKNFLDLQVAKFVADDSRSVLILPEGLTLEEQIYVTYTAKLLDVSILLEQRDGVKRVKLVKKSK